MSDERRRALGIGDDPYVDVPLWESTCLACGDVIEVGQVVCDDCLDHDEYDDEAT